MSFRVYEINTGRHLLDFFCTQPVYYLKEYVHKLTWPDGKVVLERLLDDVLKYIVGLKDDSVAFLGTFASHVWWGRYGKTGEEPLFCKGEPLSFRGYEDDGFAKVVYDELL